MRWRRASKRSSNSLGAPGSGRRASGLPSSNNGSPSGERPGTAIAGTQAIWTTATRVYVRCSTGGSGPSVGFCQGWG